MGRPPAHDTAKLTRDLVQCFWERGCDAPVSAVLESTGAKAASLYARFGSKKGMLLAALDAYAREHLDDLRKLLASLPPEPMRIRAVLDSAVKCFDDPLHRGCLLVNGVLEAGPQHPDVTERLQKHMRDIRAEFSWALSETPGLSGFFTVESAAQYLQAQVWALKIMARLNPRHDLGQQLVEQAMYALFGATGATGATGPGGAAPLRLQNSRGSDG